MQVIILYQQNTIIVRIILKLFLLTLYRFYVDGEWVEVITDTRLPCIRDDSTGYMTPVYAKSPERGGALGISG